MALIAICLGFFVVILDTTVVNVALPPMGAALRVDVTGLQWVVDGYTLVFAALLLLGGALGDRIGPRTAFLSGLALFAVASALCGLAPTAALLIGARLVQGIGAALLVPSSLALLSSISPGRAERAKAVGIWGAVGAGAASFGPIVGGALATGIGWRSIFFVNVPVCVIAGLLVAALVNAVPGRARPLALLSHLLIVAAVAGLVFAVIEAGSAQRQPAAIVAAAVVALLAGGALIVGQRRGAQPLFPAVLLRRGPFLAGNTVGFLLNFGFFGQLFVISLYLQQQLGYSPLLAGLALLPETAMGIIASTLGGRLTAARGPRTPMIVGLLLGALGFAGLLLAQPHTPYGVLVAPLMFIGFGTAFCMPAATTATVEAAPAELVGLAAAAFNASRQIGGAIGIAALGTTLVIAGGGAVTSGAGSTGLHAAAIIAAIGFTVAVLITYRTKENDNGEPRRH